MVSAKAKARYFTSTGWRLNALQAEQFPAWVRPRAPRMRVPAVLLRQPSATSRSSPLPAGEVPSTRWEPNT